MAYKVVCTKCGKPVKVVVSSDGKYWDVKCQCARSVKGEWEIQEVGVIPLKSRLKHCSGCYENIYNGNNTVGVKECWNLKSAKLVMKTTDDRRRTTAGAGKPDFAQGLCPDMRRTLLCPRDYAGHAELKIS